MIAAIAHAQVQPQPKSLAVQGCSGLATVIRSQGRLFVDVQELAGITAGSLKFNPDGMVITLPACEAFPSSGGNEASKAGFSHGFMNAAIEAMGSIREWGGILQATVQDRYPVGSAMTGNTILAHQERSGESVALASAAVSTDSDRRGLELLTNEFNSLKAWTEMFLKARRSLTALYMTLSDTPFQDDDQAQKIIRCGQFLAQMFPGGVFQDDPACH
jgi:hypothetical protein